MSLFRNGYLYIADRVARRLMTMSHPLSQKRKERWFGRFLLRAIAVAVTVHYISLIWLLQGMSIQGAVGRHNLFAFMDLSQAFSLRSNKNMTFIETKPPSIRILWNIESTSTEQGKQRRQLLRETYLFNRNPTNQTNQRDADNNLLCSFHNVHNVAESAATDVVPGCRLYYSFVITDTHSFDWKNETDVRVWGGELGISAWLESLQDSWNQWDYIVWVDSRTLVAPSDLVGLIHHINAKNDPRKIIIETPQTEIPIHCGGQCSWDQELLSRDGRLLLTSTLLLSSLNLTKNPCRRLMGLNTFQLLRTCLMSPFDNNQTQSDDNIDHQFIGHQYAHADDDRFRQMWQQHLASTQFYRKFGRKHKVHHISAKFNRDPTRFTNELRDLKTALIHWGFQPDQIYLYDGVFPDYILNDYRWEEHLEFLKDLELDDLGAGFWFWKAPLLEHQLQLLEDDDFVVFSNPMFSNHLPWLGELLETMISRQANMAVYQIFFPENQWTKRELYELLCTNVPERVLSSDTSNQYSGHFLVLRKTTGTMDFIRQFTRLAANYHLLSDQPGILPERPVFQQHRRDQSIISLLLKCHYREAGKQVFLQPLLKDLGWFEAFTFHFEPFLIA